MIEWNTCKVKAGFLMFPTRTFHRPEMSYVSIPNPSPPLPLRVWHSSQWLLGILSSGMPPGSQNLDPISDQCCYNIVVLLPGWISVWCNVVWRWWTGICHQQCDIWDHRTREECFVSGLRGELKLVWFFSIFKPFTGKGGQSQAYTRFTM